MTSGQTALPIEMVPVVVAPMLMTVAVDAPSIVIDVVPPIEALPPAAATIAALLSPATRMTATPRSLLQQVAMLRSGVLRRSIATCCSNDRGVAVTRDEDGASWGASTSGGSPLDLDTVIGSTAAGGGRESRDLDD